MQFLSYFIKSKTMFIALLQAAAGILLVLMGEFPQLGYLVTAKSVVDMILRFVTNKPLSAK